MKVMMVMRVMLAHWQNLQNTQTDKKAFSTSAIFPQETIVVPSTIIFGLVQTNVRVFSLSEMNEQIGPLDYGHWGVNPEPLNCTACFRGSWTLGKLTNTELSIICENEGKCGGH